MPVPEGKLLINSILLIQSGKIIHTFQKQELPNYGVFDEKRYFSPGTNRQTYFEFNKMKIEFLICEDMWVENYVRSKKKIDLIIIVNASPYEIGKLKLRRKLAAKRAKYFNANLIYINLVGSQDDLIFDGGSFVMNKFGKVVMQTDFFKESEEVFTINHSMKNKVKKQYDDLELLYKALMIGLRNYMDKNSFKSVVLGLSGGIDSALTLAILADTIEIKNIYSFFLPTLYSSRESKIDAFDLSRNLGLKTNSISIEILRKNVLKSIKPFLENLTEDITEENIQSRLRGLILMAFSNKFNSLLVTTGNKSELAVGYSTLYGDMCGGYSLLKDVYKTKVFELCSWRNRNCLDEFKVKKLNIIPDTIMKKEPTAELKFNQMDKDSLPPYEVLDKILELIIDQNRDLSFILKKGFSEKLVKKIWKMIKNSEFKRYQSAIGPKVSKMALFSDRRFPLTNQFKI